METKTIYDMKLARDTFITLMSQRGSGKSVLISNLIHYFLTDEEHRCDYVYVFSETAGLNQVTNHSYSFFDKRAIIDPSDVRVVNNFVTHLVESQKKTNFRTHILLVFDDIALGKKWEVLDFLASRGRHYSITVILSAQISNCVVSPKCRTNVDFALWRKLGTEDIKKDIYKYMSISEFRKSEDLIDATLENTTDFRFMLFDNRAARDGQDKIHLVKAIELPEGFEYKVAAPEPTRKRNQRPRIQW
jgi:GTPase SAR1 family protein